MAYTPQVGDISLFPNEKHTAGDKLPSMTGYIIMPDGQKWEVSVWTKPGRNDTRFLSGVAKPKQDRQPEQAQQPAKQQTQPEAQSDDLPF